MRALLRYGLLLLRARLILLRIRIQFGPLYRAIIRAEDDMRVMKKGKKEKEV